MKSVTVRDLQKSVRECVDIAQDDRVVITRHGKPAALLVGIEGDEWETVVLQTSASFWKLIERRRKEPTISLEEMKARVANPRAAAATAKRPTNARTAGETLFEKYLQQNGYLDYDFEPEIEGADAKPDYRIRTRAGEILADVKDFEPDDVRLLKTGTGGAIDVHRRIRNRIEKLKNKFKTMRGSTPCVGVLHSPGIAVDVYPEDPDVMLAAMHGNITISIPFDERRKVFDSSRTRYGFGKGAQLQPKKNTTISALLTLRNVPVGEFRIERHLNHISEEREPEFGDAFADLGPDQESQAGLIIWENPYAANPLPRSVFCGPFDERWGVDEADGRYRRIFAGEGIALMERERSSAEHRPRKPRPGRRT